VEALKATLGPVQEDLDKTEKALTELLLRLPNLPSPQSATGQNTGGK
jgi:seryl-tRNA synthetase